VAGDERLGVSRADVDREGPAYTVELLRALRAAAPEDELVFVVGGDMAHFLPAWREPEEVLALARLAVAEREGVARQEILERLAPLRGAQDRVDFFAMPRIDVSSTLIRRRAAAGLPIRYLVPDAVAEHIARRGLYGAAYPGGSR
jgi:nicotinate-nucleotide adenylyltransferase